MDNLQMAFRGSRLALFYHGAMTLLFLLVVYSELASGWGRFLGVCFAAVYLCFEYRRAFAWRWRHMVSLGCTSGRWFLVDADSRYHIDTIRVRAYFFFAWELRMQLGDDVIVVWLWRDMLDKQQWRLLRSLLSMANYG